MKPVTPCGVVAGARLAAENPAYAALASERAASMFGLHVVQHAVQDETHNRTRFFIVTRADQHKQAGPTGKDCISLADRKSTRLNSSHSQQSRMPSSA